jgi:hypothetical protein
MIDNLLNHPNFLLVAFFVFFSIFLLGSTEIAQPPELPEEDRKL